jgi:D-alanyl-D-alanine-carboxypeptidase/D-alanyl-D-alanine-endopeptidase
MRRLVLSALAILLASAPLAAQAPSPPAPAQLEQVIPAIDRHFRRFQEEAHLPGLVWGIVRDGRLVHFGASGVQDLESRRPMSADTLFRIASMSKAFTALAILKLRDEGRLSLDAPAETYVPELRGWRYPTTDSPRISVRDLLSHVGGFVTDDPWGDRQTPLPEAEFTEMLRTGVPFTRPPQTAFEYSNFGYALLGRIITNVSGRPFENYIGEEIMRPLGMASTGYDISRSPAARRALGYRWENEAWSREPDLARGAFGAMGGVQTRASDYARWVAFLLSAWPPRDGAEQGPVRRSSVRELAQGLNFVQLRARPVLPGGQPCPIPGAYAKGFIVAQDCLLGTTLTHGGGYPGYGSFLLLLPDHGVGLFALANRTYGAPSPPVFLAALEMERAGLLPVRVVPVSAALASAYRAAGAIFRAGRLDPGRSLLAMNFLMDRSAENWASELARLKAEAGECRTDAPIIATGALSGRFTWACERATLQGNLLLAPTHPPGIQALRLQVAPPS